MQRSADVVHASAPGVKLGRGDVAGLVIVFALMLFWSFIRSRHTVFWGDEIMGMLVMTRPNWPSLLHFWWDGIDSSGIWFYVFGRPWLAIFGTSETALRLYSATGVTVSATLIWLAARRFYSILQTASAVLLVYFGTWVLRWQLANGRTYGVLLAFAALVLLLIFTGEGERYRKPGAGFVILTGLAYAGLSGSHQLGIVYAGFFFTVQIVLDLLAKRPRYRLYAAAALSGCVTLFSVRNILATAALGQPHFWTLKPGFLDLISFKMVFDNHVRVVLLGLLALLLVTGAGLRFAPARRPVYVLLLGFAGLDLFFFGLSQFTTSIYVDRYMMPFAFATVLLLCELMDQLRRARFGARFLSFAVPVALFLIVPLLYRSAWARVDNPMPDAMAAFYAAVPQGMTVVCQDPTSMLMAHFYHADPLGRRYVMAVDQNLILQTAKLNKDTSGYKEFLLLKQHGFASDDILSTDQVLRQMTATGKDFIVVTGAPHTWLKMTLVNNPRWQIAKVGQVKDLELWQVHAVAIR